MTLPSLPLPNVLYNVQVNRGVTGPRTLLSCNPLGAVDLYDHDDDSNRQKWQFIPLPDGSYNIRVFGGVTNGCVLLSCKGDGRLVDLYTKDDNSGRQRWFLDPLPIGCFRIRVKGGVSDGRELLSCSGDGKRVDVWTADDNSGRQQWVLKPESIELDRIEFDLPKAMVSVQPDFVSEAVIYNNTSVSHVETAAFSRKAITSSSFEQKHGFSFTVSATKNFGTPVFASGSISVSIETSHMWTYTQSQTREDTRTYSMQVTVPPYRKLTALAVVTMTKLDVPYVAYGSSKLTGASVAVNGVWQGISAGQIVHTLTESPL